MLNFLSIFLLVYGVLAISHIVFQIILCHSDHRRQNKKSFKDFHSNYQASVSVIVPAYNEVPQILKNCIDSIVAQKIPDIEIIVVDDGSKNREELIEKVYDTYQSNQNVKILLPEENKGKNILTRLITYRYWSAFHQERAAQSRFHVVMCCSGPFSAYRKEIIEEIKEKYITQYFLGENCTYGDDRHLTNLVLEAGYEVAFQSDSQVYTFVPETIGGYIKQQVRWNKSFYREMLWTIKFAHKHHFYMMYDLVMQFILPFMLVVSLIAMIEQTILYQNFGHLYQYLIVLVLIAIFRSLYGIYRTKDIGFLLFVIYGFMHVLLLLPVRFYALLTLKSTKWGTR